MDIRKLGKAVRYERFKCADLAESSRSMMQRVRQKVQLFARRSKETVESSGREKSVSKDSTFYAGCIGKQKRERNWNVT